MRNRICHACRRRLLWIGYFQFDCFSYCLFGPDRTPHMGKAQIFFFALVWKFFPPVRKSRKRQRALALPMRASSVPRGWLRKAKRVTSAANSVWPESASWRIPPWNEPAPFRS